MVGGTTLQLGFVKLIYKFTAEMRKTGGEVLFRGSVAYRVQTA